MKKMPGKHKYPTISFRVSPMERQEIEAKIAVSGLQKKDYFIRSCIYNKVVVVGKEEQIDRIVQAIHIMQEKIREIDKEIQNWRMPVLQEDLASMQAEYTAMIKAILWLLKGLAEE